MKGGKEEGRRVSMYIYISLQYRYIVNNKGLRPALAGYLRFVSTQAYKNAPLQVWDTVECRLSFRYSEGVQLACGC